MGKKMYTKLMIFLSILLLAGTTYTNAYSASFVVTNGASSPQSGFTTMSDVMYYIYNNRAEDINVTFDSSVKEVYIASSPYFTIPGGIGKIIMDGKCTVTFISEGSGFCGFWNSNASNDLTFIGITFQGFSNGGSNGSAILNEGMLTLNNVNFLNNSNTGTEGINSGGAIASYNGSITFQNRVYFENNEATNGLGGAIFLNNSTLTVGNNSKGIFMGNKALQGGGAIYFYNGSNLITNPSGTPDFITLTFTGNKVTSTSNTYFSAGGAILFSGNNALSLNLTGAVFNSNLAVGGGAISVAGTLIGQTLSTPALNVSYCKFSGNMAKDPVFNPTDTTTFSNRGLGGAIYTTGTLFMDEYCAFTTNYASSNAGAIYYANAGTLDIRGIFKGNTAELSGGGILVMDEGIVQNPINVYGAVKTGSIVTTCVYESNQANGGNGGFLSCQRTPVSIMGAEGVKATFSKNIACYSGGAVYSFLGDLTVKDAIFENNSQIINAIVDPDSLGGGGGGAIAVKGSDAVPVTLTVTNVLFNSNFASKGGAISVLTANDKLIISDPQESDFTRFFLNTAKFERKTATSSGPAIIDIGAGGAIMSLGDVTINIARTVPQTYNALTPYEAAQFHDNRSGSFGGAIDCERNFSGTNIYFHQNMSTAGGALYLRLEPNEAATVSSSLFRSNGFGYGGAVNIENYNADATAYIPSGSYYSNNNTYISNRATIGGAVHGTMATSVAFMGDTLTGNLALGGNAAPYGYGGAIYMYKGLLTVGDATDINKKNIFTNNYAFRTNATGAAIFATGQVIIQNGNEFTGNLAGYKSGESIINGAVIVIGDETLSANNLIKGSMIQDSKGSLPDEVGLGALDGVSSHGIGFHELFGTNPIGNVTITDNTIQNNNYGISISPYAELVKVSANKLFSDNTEHIHTGQHSPRRAPDFGKLSTYGNLGIGMPLVYADKNGQTTLMLTKGIDDGSLFDIYIKNPDGTITYTGNTLLWDNLSSQEKSSRKVLLTDYYPSLTDTASVYLVTSIDAFGNTSEFSNSMIPLQVNIEDVADSRINWDEAIFSGSWKDDYTFYGIGENDYTPYLDEKMAFVNINKYSGIIYIVPSDDKGWQFALQTKDDGTGSKRFGSWFFDGKHGEEITMKTYRVVQNYDFGNASNPAYQLNDYKLLAVVDGADNPLRANKYLSTGNNTLSGLTGGGGGLLIEKNPNHPEGTVKLDATIVPIGSTTAGVMDAGFIVVDSIADFVVDASSGYAGLWLNSSNGSSSEYGPRLIIEKGAGNCGIFSLDGGAILTTDVNFMALYHHQLDENNWSWLSHPEGFSFSQGGSLGSSFLSTASSTSNPFVSDIISASPQAGTFLQTYSYNESFRATKKPNFGSNGSAWDPKGNNIKGFIAGIASNTNNARDLYLSLPNYAYVFRNNTVPAAWPNYFGDVAVSYTTCTRTDQYQLAAKYLGKPAITTIAEADAETKSLVAAYHSGWNLVGNPYTKSYVPDANVGAVAMPTPDGKNYIYRNLDGIVLNRPDTLNNVIITPGQPDNTGNFRIPPLTAFYVQSKAAGSVNLTGSLNGDNSLQLRSSRPAPGIIRIDLLKDSVCMGQTVLTFAQGATPVSNWGLDVPLMATTAADVYLPDKMGSAMAINALGEDSHEFSTPIGIKIDQPGNYKFRISEIENIDSELLILKDNSTETPVQQGDIYSFSVSAKGNIENRFSIAGLKVATSNKEVSITNTPFVYANDQSITVNNLSGKSAISVFDSMGHIYYQVETTDNKYVISPVQPGYYLIKIIQDNNLTYNIKTVLYK